MKTKPFIHLNQIQSFGPMSLDVTIQTLSCLDDGYYGFDSVWDGIWVPDRVSLQRRPSLWDGVSVWPPWTAERPPRRLSRQTRIAQTIMAGKEGGERVIIQTKMHSGGLIFFSDYTDCTRLLGSDAFQILIYKTNVTFASFRMRFFFFGPPTYLNHFSMFFFLKKGMP